MRPFKAVARAVALSWTTLAPGWVMAGACDDVGGRDCQLQVQAPVTYNGWQTQGWAYYCTGDHRSYLGSRLGLPGHWASDNSCFSIIEAPWAEDEPDKFDALITNWCVTSQQLTVTLGCGR